MEGRGYALRERLGWQSSRPRARERRSVAPSERITCQIGRQPATVREVLTSSRAHLMQIRSPRLLRSTSAALFAAIAFAPVAPRGALLAAQDTTRPRLAAPGSDSL